jgi:hypothetical protein
MEFQTEAQKKVYERVAQILKEEFGKMAQPREDNPSFSIQRGSAFVQVTVVPINEQYTTIRAHSWVVTGVENTPELLQYLLKENLQMRFGAFGVDDVGDICFTHAFLGETVDSASLMYSTIGVASVADDYDDKIVQRFGGQRAVDRTT